MKSLVLTASLIRSSNTHYLDAGRVAYHKNVGDAHTFITSDVSQQLLMRRGKEAVPQVVLLFRV